MSKVGFTQTILPLRGESESAFRARALGWCALFDAQREPDQVVGFTEHWHAGELVRITVKVAPDERGAPGRQLMALMDEITRWE